MIKDFLTYIAEGVPDPDAYRPSRINLFSRGSGQAPSHWNNSPFLSGSAAVSAFGRNPKSLKKKKALNYKEFMNALKKINK